MQFGWRESEKNVECCGSTQLFVRCRSFRVPLDWSAPNEKLRRAAALHIAAPIFCLFNFTRMIVG